MSDPVDFNNQVDNVKLFVGQIPKELIEEEIQEYFEEFGPIVEISVIRDNATLASKGCAFVTYMYAQSAHAAVAKLHDKVKLPNSLNALQVRLAETHVVRENKLFIGMLPKTVGEQDLHHMFSQYGELREVHIIRGPEGSPKGCAFVKFVDRQAAVNAIDDLNDTIPMGATRPLVVKFADGKKSQAAARGAGPDYWPSAQAPLQRMDNHLAQAQQKRIVYPPYAMPVNHMPMSFMQYANQPPSPVGSTPTMPTSQGFMYITSPHGGPATSYYPHQPTPAGQVSPPSSAYNIVPPSEFVDNSNMGRTNSLHNQGIDPSRREQLADSNSSAVSYSRGNSAMHQPNRMLYEKDSDGPLNSMPSNDGNDFSYSRPPEGPSGANLFIYHLPRDLTDADLATLFAPFGNVISAKVFVDKKTSDSKGFGFVSYDVLESADAAIESMNGFQIGSKRLKVQHKKVAATGVSFGQHNVVQHNQPHHMQQQHHHQLQHQPQQHQLQHHQNQQHQHEQFRQRQTHQQVQQYSPYLGGNTMGGDNGGTVTLQYGGDVTASGGPPANVVRHNVMGEEPPLHSMMMMNSTQKTMMRVDDDRAGGSRQVLPNSGAETDPNYTLSLPPGSGGTSSVANSSGTGLSDLAINGEDEVEHCSVRDEEARVRSSPANAPPINGHDGTMSNILSVSPVVTEEFSATEALPGDNNHDSCCSPSPTTAAASSTNVTDGLLQASDDMRRYTSY